MTPRLRFAVLASALVVATAVVPGCLGEDIAPASDTPTTGTDAGADATPAEGNDGGGGSDAAGPTCPTGFADCDEDATNGCETDIRSNAAHCGACKHACGGTATCTAGACQVEQIQSGLTKSYGLEVAGPRLLWFEPAMIRGCRADGCNTSTAIMVDVNATLTPVTSAPHQMVLDGAGNFYFSQCPSAASDCAIAQCPVTGCKLNGATYLVQPNGLRRPTSYGAGIGVVYTFQGIDRGFKWDIAGKTATPLAYMMADSTAEMWSDATRFVYLDPTTSLANPQGGVYVCPLAGCASRSTLVPPPVKHLAIANDVFYTTSPATSPTINFGNSSVISCGLGGCGGDGKVLAKNQAFVGDVTADDKEVFWTTLGAANPDANTSAIGTVMKCKLPDCAGGPTKLADAVVNPVAVRVDKDYVYWITYGSGGAANGAIYRLRR